MTSTNKSAVERLRAMDTQNKKVQGSETGSASSAVTRLRAMENQSNLPSTSDEEKNKGGVLGGIGYVGEKIGLGIVQGVEGIFDYVGAGVLDLFGADDAAEDVLENDWVDYSHADEWFNPGEGWKVAGDVAGGIGTSVPGLAAGTIAAVATGGASLVPTIAGLATSGLSAAGTSTKEAYQETGELGLKEFGYGAIMGGVEAGTELLSGKLGAGILKNADDLAAALGKTASKTAKAVSAKTIAASLGKEFASEAFEEGFAELVSPYAKRLTYDPNAQNATIEEIGYAALVGGLSGMVMGGGTTTITQGTNLARGSKAVDAGRVTSIMDTAKAFSDYEGTSPTKLSSMEAIHDLYTRLEAQGVRESTKLTVNQRRAIGELQSLTTSAVFEPAMQKSAISAIEGADVIAQKLNADGQIKIVDGKMQAVTAESLEELQKQGIEVRDITAEDIRGGVDVKDGKSISKAMKENDLLRYIAASDVAGRFMMTAKEVETAARAGTKIRSQAELNNYIEKATPEQRAALGAELGIAENEWDTLKLQRFNEAAAAYRESGKLDAKRAEMKANAEKKKAAERINALKQKVETNKIDEYLRENVDGYASMGEANKSMIRQIVREGRASGISDADILSYAKVAEHTGLNVEFDASLKEGEAGYYDPKGNKIVVNPKTAKKQELILIHELDHALRKFVASDKVHTIAYKNADKRLSQKTRDMIEREYSDQDADVSREELFADEASAYYSEAILGGKVTVDMLLGKETTLKQKILSFFTSAARAYSGDAALAKEARAHYRRFKKLFDSFAERNQYRNAEMANSRSHGATVDKSARSSMETTSETYKKRIETWDQKTEGFSFVLGDTSRVIANIEIDGKKIGNKQIRLDATKVKSILKGHQEMDIEVIKSLPQITNDPILVLESKTKKGRIVLFGEVIAKNGKPVMLAIELNPTTRSGKTTYLDIVKVASAYTRRNTQNLIDSSVIKYVDKNKDRVDNWLKVNRLQLPLPNSQNPSVNTSIPQSAEKSTPSAKKVSESARKSTSHEATLDSDYLDAVNRGDMETAQRMVDEAAKKAGYDKLFYHGSKKGGGFTKFRDWQYFTENKQYAERYTDRDKKGSLYTTYVKLENPFDTRKAKDRRLFNEIRQEYGLSDIQASGLPDWTDGYDISDYIDENDLSYDGIVLDEGGDLVNGKPVSRGESYVVRKSAQIKSADPVTYDDNGNVIPLSERFNSKNSDIRYSTEFEADLEAARGSIVMDLSSYKPRGRKETIEYGKAVGDDAYTRFQIQATNQQAGLEKELKRLGVKNGEALVQSARSASNAAATMIGDEQLRIGDGSYKEQGEGLEKIYHSILNGEAIESQLKGLSKQEREAKLEAYSSDFFAYLFHMHNADRMSLEQRSIEENDERIKTLEKKVKRRVEVEAKIKAKGEDSDIKTLRIEKAKLDREIKTLMEEVAEFVPAENKPVIGHAVDEDGRTVITTAEGEAIPYTANESKVIAEEILKLHPEFKESAEKVWAYNKNLNQYRVDTGLISQESFDRMQALYPHYVPTYREGSRTGIAAMSGKYALKVKATVKSAKGGLRPLCRPDVIMARQTEETIKAGRVNQLARTYYDAAGDSVTTISKVDAKPDETVDFDPTTIAPKNNRVTFYKDGEKIEIEVDKNVFDGFDAFNSQSDVGGIISGTFGKVMDLYKRLITSYSPIFTIRNAIRDLQDAGINTKYGKTFIKNYGRAISEIKNNGKYWKMYRAAGGLSSSLFDYEKGFGGSTNSWGLTKAEGNPLQKLGTTIENANVFIEQLPRLAEFISSMEAKNSIEQAILDSADVTTNFGRSGKFAKWLNRNFIPFLNPSIQGFSKLIRNVTDRKTAKELVAFLIKAALLGFAPQIINQLFLKDDEEYEKLRDSDKENNYIIRFGDQFVKIPKGRVVAAMSGIINRTANTVNGKEDAWEGYLDSVLQNLTPVDSASRDILSPFRDVKANKTWYGTEIEGRQFENVPIEERTDEGTSWIAEVLAQLPTSKAMELSPKKIHYLIDQYTGIIGDMVLPATSKKAQKDMFSGAFVIDPVTSNDLSNRFYKQYDKAVQTKNSTKSSEEDIEIASFRYKYLGKIKDTVSEMQKAKREVQASDLKATEKLKQTREIQAAINVLYEEALADIDKLTEIYNGTYYLGAADIYSNYVASGINDEQYASLRYAETIRSYYGAETAFSQYNSAVYEKASVFNKAGIDWDTYYEYYFTTRGIESDVDKNGNTVAGSKRKKIEKAIKSLGVSQTERLLLTAAAGYSLTETEKKRLISYINKLAVTKDEKIAIAEACGFTVKNGRISLK